jgi:hypothetical protein
MFFFLKENGGGTDGLVSTSPAAICFHRRQGQCGLSDPTRIIAVSALNHNEGFMWQPRVPGKSRLCLTAADGLGDSYIGRVRLNTPHLKGMNDGDEIAFTVRQRGQALPGNGLVVDPALGHPSRSTLAGNFGLSRKLSAVAGCVRV